MRGWRQASREAIRPKPQNHPCANCPERCPQLTHYGQGTNCKVQNCPCQEFKPVKRAKYNDARTEAQGISFQSAFEAKVATDLKYLQMAGEADFDEIERQVKFPFIIKKKRLKHFYLADFVVTLKNGRKRIYEAKGFRTAQYELKRELVEILYPNVEFVEIRG